ncbi:uncharacterized protein L203_105277 [Cryptococcus depauperatus CBS 7841]|uniref:Uncharacterized protein n=1 Tax=Cryptococcus depauperatus CBS 7841 TaxID=1295531 RepID=A0A1E3HYH9_9TREE|nr:hypothetical protein L203_05648 [Cryptococcus depauperatus CBS 7841]
MDLSDSELPSATQQTRPIISGLVTCYPIYTRTLDGELDSLKLKWQYALYAREGPVASRNDESPSEILEAAIRKHMELGEVADDYGTESWNLIDRSRSQPILPAETGRMALQLAKTFNQEPYRNMTAMTPTDFNVNIADIRFPSWVNDAWRNYPALQFSLKKINFPVDFLKPPQPATQSQQFSEMGALVFGLASDGGYKEVFEPGAYQSIGAPLGPEGCRETSSYAPSADGATNTRPAWLPVPSNPFQDVGPIPQQDCGTFPATSEQSQLPRPPSDSHPAAPLNIQDNAAWDPARTGLVTQSPGSRRNDWDAYLRSGSNDEGGDRTLNGFSNFGPVLWDKGDWSMMCLPENDELNNQDPFTKDPSAMSPSWYL